MIAEDEAETRARGTDRHIYRIYKSLRRDKCFSQSLVLISQSITFWMYS